MEGGPAHGIGAGVLGAQSAEATTGGREAPKRRLDGALSRALPARSSKDVGVSRYG
jgi:hypothetical protein